jgi:tetratricopeptide (TPR) repeat protein
VRVAALLLFLAAAASIPRGARADDDAAEARQQYNLGTTAYRDRRYVEAALHFEAAAAQRAHAVTLYTAALAWEQANRPDRACDDYARALEVPGLSPQQTGHAQGRVANFEKTLGTLVVTAPDGWRVQLEGLTEVGVPARLHASPGVHKLTAHAPKGPVDRRDVTMEAGQTTRIELEDAPSAERPEAAPTRDEPKAVAPPAPPVSTPSAGIRRPLGFAAIGVGVATLGAGALLGVQALGARDAYDAAPTRAGYDHAQALQTWTTIAFVAGGVFAAGGIVLVLMPEPKANASSSASLVVRATPRGIAAGGAF